MDALVRGFEDTTLDMAKWTHAAHLTVALYFLQHHSRDEATRRMRDGLQRFIAAKGVAPTAYHETITLAWMAVVARFLEEHDGDPDLARELVRECCDKHYLLAFYSRDVLMSDAARTHWVPPDVAPISTRR